MTRVCREKTTGIASFHEGLRTISPRAVSSICCSPIWASWSKLPLRSPVASYSTLASGSRVGEPDSGEDDFSAEISPGISTMSPVIPCWARCCWAARWRSLHFPVGVSGQTNNIVMETATMTMNGTMKATRHATWGVRCLSCTSESKIAGIKKYVTPPPALPKPAVKELPVPTIFLSKKPVDHTWQGTKLPPRIPTKKRRAIRPLALVTAPASTVGMEPASKQATKVYRGP